METRSAYCRTGHQTEFDVFQCADDHGFQVAADDRFLTCLQHSCRSRGVTAMRTAPSQLLHVQVVRVNGRLTWSRHCSLSDQVRRLTTVGRTMANGANLTHRASGSILGVTAVEGEARMERRRMIGGAAHCQGHRRFPTERLDGTESGNWVVSGNDRTLDAQA